MQIIQVNFHVKPEYLQAFKNASIENATASLKEPGVLEFNIFQQVEDPTIFIFLEIYRNPESPSQHRETQHFKRWLELVNPMLVQPRSRSAYQKIFPIG